MLEYIIPMVILMIGCYMMGHWFGYDKGYEDGQEYVESVRRVNEKKGEVK